MSTMHDSTQISRYVALDVHRNYVVVGAVDSQQHIVLSPCDFGFERFAAWAPTHLSETDAVVPRSKLQCLGPLRSIGTTRGPGHCSSSPGGEADERRTCQNRCA